MGEQASDAGSGERSRGVDCPDLDRTLMKFYIPPAVAIAILFISFAPRHDMMGIGPAKLDTAKLDAAELFVHPGISALQGMSVKTLKECFLDPRNQVKLVGTEQGDDGTVLRLQIASSRIMLVHLRFFDHHRYALLDMIVTPEGAHVVDPEQLWGMAHSIILGNCVIGKAG